MIHSSYQHHLHPCFIARYSKGKIEIFNKKWIPISDLGLYKTLEQDGSIISEEYANKLIKEKLTLEATLGKTSAIQSSKVKALDFTSCAFSREKNRLIRNFKSFDSKRLFLTYTKIAMRSFKLPHP